MKIMGVQFDQGDNKLGATFGLIGGVGQTILNIDVPTGFLSKLGEAGITAALCGFLGVAGKELFVITRRALIAYFRNRKNKKS